MKKLSLIAVIAILALLFVGCGTKSVQPKEIDVTGKTLDDACRVLLAEGWVTEAVDDTPNSDYIPGGYENGVTEYNNCKVTHVEFEPSKSAGKGYVTRPTCTVHFESGDQTFLEDMYAYDLYAYYDMCYDFWEQFLEGGRSEELLGLAKSMRDEVAAYEDDRVPLSCKEAHSHLVKEYDALLDTLNGDASPYDFDIEIIRQEHEQLKEKMREHSSAMSSKYGTGKAAKTTQSSKPDDAITWQEASQHIGETVTIYGSVASVDYSETSNGQPTFIDLGAAYPDASRVTVIIWGENRGAFPEPPEEMYGGKTICVTGVPYLYEGVCNIEVSSPSQIDFI